MGNILSTNPVTETNEDSRSTSMREDFPKEQTNLDLVVYRQQMNLDAMDFWDPFPMCPEAKLGKENEAVQDRTTPSTFYLRLNRVHLLRVTDYGSAQEKYEAQYVNPARLTIDTREQNNTEISLLKNAIQKFLEAQKTASKTLSVASPLTSNSLFRITTQKQEALQLQDRTPVDPYNSGAIVVYTPR